jgi:predicted transcriptional regulator
VATGDAAVSETRDRLATHVRSHPGVHFSDLVRELDLAPGQVQYHVRKLGASDRVVAEEVGDRTHYYPPEYDPWERRALALLRRETAGDIVAALIADGTARPQAVADELDIARSTLEWHLDRLVAHDVVEKRRDERGHVHLELTDPEATVGVLRNADPSLIGRLVSRFNRLLDQLLEDAG